MYGHTVHVKRFIVDRLDPVDKELLTRALVQTILDKSLCIAEHTPQGPHLSSLRSTVGGLSDPEVFIS